MSSANTFSLVFPRSHFTFGVLSILLQPPAVSLSDFFLISLSLESVITLKFPVTAAHYIMKL